MTALVLTSDNLKILRRAVADGLKHVGSAHLSEAIAAGIGYRTHAAALAAASTSIDTAEIVLINTEKFAERLAQLGYDRTSLKRAKSIFANPGIPENGQVLVRTKPADAADIKYNSNRRRAWRNMLVSAVNAGLEQGVFSLHPGDNRWPKPKDHSTDHGAVYHYEFSGGIPAVAWVGDAGFDELSIHVAVWPTPDGAYRVVAANAGFWAGEAYASGWLERRRGAWLQTSLHAFHVRKSRIMTLASASVVPRGFGDRGGVIL
jgi:hypothetical protein